MEDKVKIRKKWPTDNGFDPSEKVHKVKIDYKRADRKTLIQRALDEALDEENTDFDLK